MKIDEVEIRHVRLSYKNSLETSFGIVKERHPVIVVLRSEGFTAYGEAATLEWPSYSPETTQTAIHVLRDFLAPNIVGRNIESPKDLHERMDSPVKVKGNYIAKSGIDTAFYVLLAQSKSISLAQELGGIKEEVEAGVSMGIARDETGNYSIDRLVEGVEKNLQKGYKRIKVKIAPGFDVEPMREIRRRLGNNFLLQVDANSAFTLDDIDKLIELDQFDLSLIEQPLSTDDFLGHAELQRRIRTPICLDESIESLNSARLAIELGSTRVINMKHGRTGGLYHALRINDYAISKGIPLWCGGMGETGIGKAHCIALASLPNFTMPMDIKPSLEYFKRDLIIPTIEMNNGLVNVPKTPGLGFGVDQKYLDECTVEKFVVTKNGLR